MDDDNYYASLTPEQTVARLISSFEDCRPLDEAAKFFRQAASTLETKGMPREHVVRTLMHQLECYAQGVEFPRMSNVLLVDADERGVDRKLILKAAVKAEVLKSGSNKTKNLADRLSLTRKQLAAIKVGPTKIPVTAARLAQVVVDNDRITTRMSELEPETMHRVRESVRRKT